MTSEDTALGVFVAHRARILDYAARIIGCPAAAEDVVKDAFLRFSKAMSAQADTVILASHAYLFGIVRNLARDWMRQFGPQRAHSVDDAALERMESLDPTPEECADFRQRVRVVAAAMEELPTRARDLLASHRLDGRTLQSLAAERGISTARAHQIIHQAACHCRYRLECRFYPACQQDGGRICALARLEAAGGGTGATLPRPSGGQAASPRPSARSG